MAIFGEKAKDKISTDENLGVDSTEEKKAKGDRREIRF